MRHQYDFLKRKKLQDISGINITPLVDVMLVLLIVFMITSPMLIAGINVDLPESKARPVSGNDEPVTITLAKDNKIYINNRSITLPDLTKKLKLILNAKKDTRIFLKADKTINYGKIIQVMDKLNLAGFNKVSLVTATYEDA